MSEPEIRLRCALPGPWLAAALVATLGASGCGARGSTIAVVYRGDVSGYQPFVHARLGNGEQARDVRAAFPSAARVTAVPTHGELPVTVFVLTAAGDSAASFAVPPVQLAARTSYQLNIVIGSHRPIATRCTGAWAGSAFTRGAPQPADKPLAAESLFVSLTASPRNAEPPRCDD